MTRRLDANPGHLRDAIPCPLIHQQARLSEDNQSKAPQLKRVRGRLEALLWLLGARPGVAFRWGEAFGSLLDRPV